MSVSKTYLGRVAEVVGLDAFVTILPELDGQLHVSEYPYYRVKIPADKLSEGREFTAKCIGIDEKSGKIQLSRKAFIHKPEGIEDGLASEGADEPRLERRPKSRR